MVVYLSIKLLSGSILVYALFCFRYDWLMKKNFRSGYFVWAMTAYGLGMGKAKFVKLETIIPCLYKERVKL